MVLIDNVPIYFVKLNSLLNKIDIISLQLKEIYITNILI